MSELAKNLPMIILAAKKLLISTVDAHGTGDVALSQIVKIIYKAEKSEAPVSPNKSID